MKKNAFSLIEALMAAVIVSIGLTAAASMIGALMAKEEINTVSLRAANLQEQAVMLYRLGLSASRIREILPESCSDSGTPPAGAFTLAFGSTSSTSCTASDGSVFLVNAASCTLIFPVTAPDGSVLSYRTNSLTIALPSTVWPVP
jgi:prepilin-type N-terminal cleavage/methylation domain-containing protein